MNIDEMYARKAKLEQEIVDLDSELHRVRARARKEGVYADVNWFNDRTRSLNNKKIELKNLNIQLHHNKQAPQDEYKRFFDIARVALDKEVFEKILSLSNMEKMNAPESPSSIDKARKAKADYQREYMRDWRKKNPEKVKASLKRYWAKKFDEKKKEAE